MSRMIEIGTNFWNIRDSFLYFGGLVDIGTHMSLIRLSTGKFLVIDTCNVNTTDKQKIDTLTENGTKIEAVIATHPFHTVYFKPFHKWYPNVPYYGTPRHLRMIPEIQWAGDISQPDNLSRWESENIFLRIPTGGDFDPVDQKNHFSTVFVFHAASKSIHIDDTVLFFDHPGCVLNCFGKSHGSMEFWNLKKGLKPTKEAPGEFRDFIQQVINDWDFENIIAAHTGNIIGGAKEKLRETLNKASPVLDQLASEAK